MTIISPLEIAVFAFLSFSVIYLFAFAVGGRLTSGKKITSSNLYKRALVLIPSYKEDGVIVSSAISAVNLKYPKERFQVVVLADSLKRSTLEELDKISDLDTLEVVFEKSTKVKSLQKAVEKYYHSGFDFVTILDADNIAEDDYLSKLNDAFCAGFNSVQGKRVAKNTNTSIAILDGASEAINNHIFRKGYNALGASASLIGSGMAFDFSIFSNIIMTMDSVGGFDRELHALLLKDGVKTKYLENTLVYDEKVDNSKNLGNQRKRWISSQFFYLRKYFIPGFKALFHGKFNYFDATVLSNLILPRVLLLGILFVFSLISFFIRDYLFLPYQLWLILLLGLIFTLVISVSSQYYNLRTIKAIFLLPLSFLTLLKSALFGWNSNKDFIHTPHGIKNLDSKYK